MIAGTAHRVAHATRKVTKVARTLGHGARILAKPGSKVEVTVMSKALGEAPEKYHFVLKDGRRLRSLYELVDELETMSDDTFRHYANEFKNDFANWIEFVIGERALADEVRRLRARQDIIRAVRSRV